VGREPSKCGQAGRKKQAARKSMVLNQTHRQGGRHKEQRKSRQGR
jgi:hypothetical protein